MLYPLFLKLDGAPALVVGAGTIARHKAESLLACGAHVTMVAPQVSAAVRAMAGRNRCLTLVEREFHPDDVMGSKIVIAATSNEAVNELVMQRCQQLGVLINVVDDPARCDFYVPSVVSRGRVQVAISTGGASPALSRRLKQQISSVLEPTLGQYADLVAQTRLRIKTILADEDYAARREANESVLGSRARQCLAQGDEKGAQQAVEAILDSLEQRKAEG